MEDPHAQAASLIRLPRSAVALAVAAWPQENGICLCVVLSHVEKS